MSLYELLLFLHVTSAIIWLGAGFLIVVLSFRGAGDPVETKHLGEINSWLAPRLFIPAALATLVLGILLVIEGPWGFDQLWILIGLGGFAATFLIGILVLKPTGEAIEQAIREHGPGPEVGLLVRRITIVSRLDVIVLFAVVADMAIKPSTGDAWTLVLGVLAAAAVAAIVLVTAPKPAPQAAPVTGTLT
jgi:hypothetical protein